MKKIYIQPVITIEPLEEDDFLMVSEPTVPKRATWEVDDENEEYKKYEYGDIGIADDYFWIE